MVVRSLSTCISLGASRIGGRLCVSFVLRPGGWRCTFGLANCLPRAGRLHCSVHCSHINVFGLEHILYLRQQRISREDWSRLHGLSHCTSMCSSAKRLFSANLISDSQDPTLDLTSYLQLPRNCGRMIMASLIYAMGCLLCPS